MGAWSFVRPLIEEIVGRQTAYVGRKPSSSPATGFPALYKEQQAAISDQAVGPASSAGSVTG
jgi:2-oxoglutarate dehydrogenase E1 component